MMIKFTFGTATRSENFESFLNVFAIKIRFLAAFITLNSLIINVNAQLPKGFSIEPNIHFGRIAKHTPKLSFQSPPLSIGSELHLNWQTYGKKVWHEWQNYPSFGISFLHYDLGDKKMFGNAFAVYPSLDIRVFKKNKIFDTYIQFGWGLAYLTQHYDQFTNPLNNAVGSALNNITDLKVRFEKRLFTHWSAQMGFSFTHFSNGAARLPNYGFNIPALNLGAKWTLNPLFTEGYIHRDSSSKSNKKWGINVFSGLGLSASSVPRGPKYPIYTASFSFVRSLNQVNLLSLGVQYEQNRVVAEFGLASGEYTTKQEASKAGSRWGVFIGDEFLFGRVGVVLQSGFYLNRYPAIQSMWFNRIGLRIYSPKIGGSKIQGHLGVFLKSHKVDAEQFCLLGGVSF
jgi:Lipid A 3-O-deacylase (PagL)